MFRWCSGADRIVFVTLADVMGKDPLSPARTRAESPEGAAFRPPFLLAYKRGVKQYSAICGGICMISLRKYQLLALYHLEQRIQHGDRHLYVTLPTGTGKGVLIAACVSSRKSQGRALVLIHRQEIAFQLVHLLCQEGLDVGLLMQGHRQLDLPIIVATLPSLEVTLPAVIEAHNSPISTVLIDEAHHAVEGSTYERSLTVLETQATHQQMVTIGFTATPYRNDRKSMFSILPTCAFTREIPEMVREGWLAPLTWDPIPVTLDLETLPTTPKMEG